MKGNKQCLYPWRESISNIIAVVSIVVALLDKPPVVIQGDVNITIGDGNKRVDIEDRNMENI